MLLLLIAVVLHAEYFYLYCPEHGSLLRCQLCGLLARGRTALKVNHLDIYCKHLTAEPPERNTVRFTGVGRCV